MSYASKAYSVAAEQFCDSLFVTVAYLYDNTRVLCKKNFYYVVTLKDREVYVHTAAGVCKAHLKERCYKSAGRDVVTSHDESFFDKFLYAVEGGAEIFRVLNRRNVVADKA